MDELTKWQRFCLWLDRQRCRIFGHDFIDLDTGPNFSGVTACYRCGEPPEGDES